jgi:hypothetical protein
LQVYDRWADAAWLAKVRSMFELSS